MGRPMTERLESVVNIGPKLAAGLRNVGVNDLGQLCDEGAVAVWERLRRADEFDCVHSLLALEGAVQGIRWHDLPADLRSDLAAYVRRSAS